MPSILELTRQWMLRLLSAAAGRDGTGWVFVVMVFVSLVAATATATVTTGARKGRRYFARSFHHSNINEGRCCVSVADKHEPMLSSVSGGDNGSGGRRRRRRHHLGRLLFRPAAPNAIADHLRESRETGRERSAHPSAAAVREARSGVSNTTTSRQGLEGGSGRTGRDVRSTAASASNVDACSEVGAGLPAEEQQDEEKLTMATSGEEIAKGGEGRRTIAPAWPSRAAVMKELGPYCDHVSVANLSPLVVRLHGFASPDECETLMALLQHRVRHAPCGDTGVVGVGVGRSSSGVDGNMSPGRPRRSRGGAGKDGKKGDGRGGGSFEDNDEGCNGSDFDDDELPEFPILPPVARVGEKPRAGKSTVFGSVEDQKSAMDAMRTSETAWLPHQPDADAWVPPQARKVLRRLAHRAAAVAGLPLTYAESWQVVRYEEGQQYRVHSDHDNNFNSLEPGGRVATLLVYLNDSFAGGHTHFPSISARRGAGPRRGGGEGSNGLSFKPVTGDAVFFQNVYTPVTDADAFDLRADPLAVHAGRPVAGGVKYALNLWFHPVPFRAQDREAQAPALGATKTKK